jgi:hypothetical protein
LLVACNVGHHSNCGHFAYCVHCLFSCHSFMGSHISSLIALRPFTVCSM